MGFQRLYYIIIFIILIILVIYNSLYNNFNPHIFEGDDKIKHILSFFLLSFLLKNIFKKISYKRIFIYFILLSILIETIQPFFNRSSDFWDIIANISGIFLYYLFFEKVFPKK